MEYLGAQGTLIHEKNLKSKIFCQTPFKKRLAIFPSPAGMSVTKLFLGYEGLAAVPFQTLCFFISFFSPFEIFLIFRNIFFIFTEQQIDSCSCCFKLLCSFLQSSLGQGQGFHDHNNRKCSNVTVHKYDIFLKFLYYLIRNVQGQGSTLFAGV